MNEVDLKINEAVSKLREEFHRPMKIFGLKSSGEYARRVASHLDMELAPHTEKSFDDGECYIKSGKEASENFEGNVRGHNVFVIQSLYTDQNETVADKFIKLCLFCGSLKDASAHEVIPIIPHLAWARQDRKTESRAPIATKYIAKMLESVGIGRVLLFDVHNLAASQNAFTIPIDNLEAKNLFADWCAVNLIKENRTKKIRILTPDSGGLQRCERFRNVLLKKLNNLGTGLDDIEIVIFDKIRVNGTVKGARIIGDVEDADVIAYDDMISTGGTIAKAVETTKASKGRVWAVCATHAICCGKVNSVFDQMDCHLVFADTVRPFRLSAENLEKVRIVETTEMVANAVKRIHSGSGSISELLKG